ncbi:MAG: hypothetical protein ACTFAL_08965 [Candidatus Electronema sp. V4]|uniref:hypothetical protein n=1 Tax=Candidatus Electronema sp. V4 TaxID=3454756 RepID=UPI0040556026
MTQAQSSIDKEKGVTEMAQSPPASASTGTATGSTNNVSTGMTATNSPPGKSVVKVALQRTLSDPTPDQALWAAIRSSTDAVRFERYQQFIEIVFNGDNYSNILKKAAKSDNGQGFSGDIALPSPIGLNLAKLNIYGPYSYTVLKVATQAFLTLQSGLWPIDGDLPIWAKSVSDFLSKDRKIDQEEEKQRSFSVESSTFKDKLSLYMADTCVLPYLDRIAGALLAIGPKDKFKDYEKLPYYNYILQYRATNPSLIELIWSYWHEEGMLAQTMNAIALRFQNQRSRPNDPLAELEIDPFCVRSTI